MGLDITFNKVSCKQIGYFRKVNFLVSFFQEYGLDVVDQKPFSITKDMVEDLLNRCNKVLENNNLAEDLLPTMNGFFFGPTEYDEWYFKDVKNVKLFIETSLLNHFDKLEPDEYIEFDIWY